MIKVVQFLRKDHCIECNTPRAIECYDVFNKPMNYPMMLDNADRIPGVLDKRELKYFKCRKCGREYGIDWTNDYVPEPLTDKLKMDRFLNDLFVKQ